LIASKKTSFIGLKSLAAVLKSQSLLSEGKVTITRICSLFSKRESGHKGNILIPEEVVYKVGEDHQEGEESLEL
jgi:hypothetical protein